MWKLFSRKSVLACGVSALLTVTIACGGIVDGDATVSPTQNQSNQMAIASEQQEPENTQVALQTASEQMTAQKGETKQQESAGVAVIVPVPAVPNDTTTIVPSLSKPQPEPSQGAVQGDTPLAMQDSAPQPAPTMDRTQGDAASATQEPPTAPAQPIVPSDGSTPALGAPAPSSVPATQVDPGLVDPPAARVQVAKVADLAPMAIVMAHEQVLTDLYEATLPSAVHISVDRSVQGGFRRAGEGSGFVWDTSGVIVTNNHVVADSDRVWAIFEDGHVFLAEIIGTDPESDLAALRIDAPAGYLKPVSLGDSEDLKVGQLAIAIGNPFGEIFTMTGGIISALGRTITGSSDSPYKIPSAIQTDAPINPGNSGGPLFDVQGNVIGINSQIISRSGSSSGVGFAIPVNIAKVVIPELIVTGSHTYAYLGISGGNVTSRVAEQNGLDSDVRGVIVSELAAGGPAADGGLVGTRGNNRGDIITAIDGVPTTTIEDLMAYLAEHTKPGQTVVVEVIRPNDSVANVDLFLEPRPVS